MVYSCGILFIKDDKLLVCHATGQQHWDLPKGKCEENERYVEAAIRECYEETGFLVEESDLTFLGEVSYRKGKRLVLYVYVGNNYPDSTELLCGSEFTTSDGFVRPEVDDYQYIDYCDAENFMTPRLISSIQKVKKEFISRNEDESNNLWTFGWL